MDLPVDRLARELRKKPLVSGIIPPRHARQMAMLFILVAFILTALWFPGPLIFGLFTLSAFLGGAYDALSKKVPASDILLGSWVFIFYLFGSVTAAGTLSKIGDLAWLVALLFFLQLVFQTGITGGLKDVKHDFVSGAKTPPIWFGTRVTKGRIFIPDSFKAYAMTIKLLNIGAALAPFLIWGVAPTMLQFVLLPILLFFILFYSVLALTGGTFHRKEKMRYLMVQELLSFMLIPLLMFSFIDFWLALLILMGPVLWFGAFTRVLYGGQLPNV
jgi:4-hydroxybenzoate polyprenyltransferase